MSIMAGLPYVAVLLIEMPDRVLLGFGIDGWGPASPPTPQDPPDSPC